MCESIALGRALEACLESSTSSLGIDRQVWELLLEDLCSCTEYRLRARLRNVVGWSDGCVNGVFHRFREVELTLFTQIPIEQQAEKHN